MYPLLTRIPPCPQDYPDLYHFSADEVRRWVGGATSPAKRRPAAAAAATAAGKGEGKEPAAPASARRSAHKPSGGSRTPATAARRRSAAAAKLRAVAEGEEEAAEAEQRQQGEAQQAEREAAQEEAQRAAEGERMQEAAAAAERRSGAASPRLRKRKVSAVGASDEAGGRAKRQEGEDGTAEEQQERGAAEPGWAGECIGLPDWAALVGVKGPVLGLHAAVLCSTAAFMATTCACCIFCLGSRASAADIDLFFASLSADKAAEVVKQALFSTTALGVCYGLLRTLYPEAA